jgi:serine/threonine-protein kinase RsbW
MTTASFTRPRGRPGVPSTIDRPNRTAEPGHLATASRAPAPQPAGPVQASQPVSVLEAAPTLTWWVFPGRGEYAATARRWVSSHTAGACDAAIDDLEIVVGELFANALRHSRSGAPGGLVTVLLTTGPAEAIVHVHDQGADDCRVPCLLQGADTASRESGRGLSIVAQLAAQWGYQPAVWCAQAFADDPAVTAGGCCTWSRIPLVAAQPPAPVNPEQRQGDAPCLCLMR